MRTLLEISRELNSIAQTGLTFCRDPYDKDRYQRLREIASEMLQVPGRIPPFRWPDEIGYPTPKLDVRGLIFRDAQVLLIKERSSQLWTLPGGWADVNHSPRENVERECLEETGYTVTSTTLVSVIEREREGYPPNVNTIYKMFFLCQISGGSPTPSLESEDIEFFDLSALPELDPERGRRSDIERGYACHLAGGGGATYCN